MDNQKTIKQLADELGVSKTAINKKVTENFKRKHFKKNGNRFVIDVDGQKAIRQMFTSSSDEKRKLDTDGIGKNKNQKVSEVSDLVCVLKERLSISDEQNNKKDIQIEKLQKLLDQQQILTLQANKKIEELELKNESDEKIKSENNPTKEKNYDESEQIFSSNEIEKDKNNLASFWKKLFRKEK